MKVTLFATSVKNLSYTSQTFTSKPGVKQKQKKQKKCNDSEYILFIWRTATEEEADWKRKSPSSPSSSILQHDCIWDWRSSGLFKIPSHKLQLRLLLLSKVQTILQRHEQYINIEICYHGFYVSSIAWLQITVQKHTCTTVGS